MSDKKEPSPSRRRQHRNQSEPVLLRLEPEHLELISGAAEHLGLARAAWMRSTLLQAAREVLKQANSG